MIPWLLLPAASAQDCGRLEAVAQEVVDEMHLILPERQVLHPGYVLDVDRNLGVTADNAGGTLHVTFLTEGAAYRNAFGWFVFDPDDVVEGQAADPSIVRAEGTLWANASFADAGGDGTCLQTGHTLDLVLDPAWVGQKVGFWLQADGFVCPDCATWATLDELQLGLDAPPAHAVVVRSTYDPAALFLGFEDLYRSAPATDHDFNDLVVRLTSEPPSIVEAFATDNDLPVLDGDADGDGVADAVDDFPDDPGRAIDNRYPAGDEVFTVAFEDLFPDVGDADYNDFVGMGQLHEVLDPQGRVVRLSGHLQIVTRGAGKDAAFHLRIDGVPPGSWSVARTDWLGAPSGAEAGMHPGGALDLTLFPDTRDALPPFNTTEGVVPERGSTVDWAFVPDAPFEPLGLALPPYDPYLRLTVSGYDLHRVGHAPLPDSINPPGTEGFLDPAGYPWVLVLPERWEPPAERVSIESAYDDFDTWRSSGGVVAAGWYRGPRQHVVPVPASLLAPLP